jgi:hypothetical protein
MKKSAVFFLLYFLLNLHLLRNLSLYGYLGVLALVYLPVLLYCVDKFPVIKIRKIGVWFLFFLLASFWPVFITFADYGFVAGAYATIRYFLTIPLVLAAYFMVSSYGNMYRLLTLFSVIVVIGSLTLPLQYLIGPISWFAEPSERANIVRYASILGSLTSTGSLIPIAFFSVLFLQTKKLLRYGMIFGLIICAIFTLQKAALLGIPLAVVVYLIYSRGRGLKTLITIMLVVGLLVSIANFLLRDWNVWQQTTSYIFEQFQIGGTNAQTSDFSIQDSIFTRLVIYPQESLGQLYKFRGALGLIFGGGFGMVGAGLMPPDVSPFITSHNGYIDLWLIGGCGLFISFIGLMYNCLRVLFIASGFPKSNKRRSKIALACFGILSIALISFAFGEAINYQPVLSTLLWSIVGFAWRIESGFTTKIKF